MKFFFLIVFSFSLSNYLLGQDTSSSGYKKFYYPNGAIASEGLLQNGKPDGYWKTYHENGVIKSEGNRSNYELTGTWNFYDEHFQKTLSIEYLNGKKNGIKKTYDPLSGKIISEEIFKNDFKEGKAVIYQDGFVFREIPFIAGKEEGKAYEFNKDGIIVSLITYKKGFINREEKINRVDKIGKKQGNWKEFYPDRTIKKEMTYRDDLLDGYLKEYSSDGNLIKAEKYVNGILQKNVAELIKLDVKNGYYESGKIKSSGTYYQGYAEGYTRYYDESGKVISAELYKDGKLLGEGIYDEKGYKQGKWKEFYPGGQLKAQGDYLNDRKVGEWIYYHMSGKIEQRGFYTKDGKPEKDWKWYYESGNLLREETFLRGQPEGVMIEYSDSGKVISKGLYTDGLKEGFWFTEEGDEKEEGEYRNGEKEGIWKSYFLRTGKPVKIGNYVGGLENGKFSIYHYNGKVSEEGNYLMGEKDGVWRKFDLDGIQQITIEYENGKETKIDGVRVKENPSKDDL